MQPKKILIIGGPTGVGESTITREITKRYPIFKRSVTATTRKPRLNEKNKIDYYFFIEKKFKDEIKKGNILEYTYIKSRNVYYGSYGPDLKKKMQKGFNIIINPDLIGAKYYQKHYNAATIFILPKSIKNLKKRIIARDPSISEKELKERLNHAKEEMKNEASFFDYHVINEQNKLKKAVEEIADIIKKEGYRLKNIDKK